MADGDVTTDTTEDTSSRSRALTPATIPHLFLVLECVRPSAGGVRYDLGQIDQVRIGRGETRCAMRLLIGGHRVLQLRVPDAHMSREHVLITRATGGLVFEDLGSTNGSRVRRSPVGGPIVLADGEVLEIGRTVFRLRTALTTPVGTPADVDSAAWSSETHQGFATLLPELARRHAQLAKVAASRIPVLLLGETGTGKEVLARAIHRASGRPGPFVAVNCGAIPATLVEGQLFGHRRGAFSGATSDELGIVRAAHRGTLFLDEIGDLPLSAQAALLRVLQEGEVVPVGSARPETVDLRILAATHRDIVEGAVRGTFRTDLLARLSGLKHELAPLRERIDDLGLLVAAILPRVVPPHSQMELTREAACWLVEHPWPLNVRQLELALSLAAVLAGDGPIDVHHLSAGGPGAVAPKERTNAGDDALRAQLLDELRRAGGNVTQVARAMGKARMQVQRWMKRFHIDPSTFRAS